METNANAVMSHVASYSQLFLDSGRSGRQAPYLAVQLSGPGPLEGKIMIITTTHNGPILCDRAGLRLRQSRIDSCHLVTLVLVFYVIPGNRCLVNETFKTRSESNRLILYSGSGNPATTTTPLNDLVHRAQQ